MKSFGMTKGCLFGLVILSLHPVLAFAQGQHSGWCQGTNNPHRSSECSASGPAIVTTGVVAGSLGGQPPLANNLPTDQTRPSIPEAVSTRIIEVTPNPVEVITGTSPVPAVTGSTGTGFTGTGQLPIVISPEPQQVLTGTGAVVPPTALPTPSFTGQGLPIIVIQPNAPQVLTGTSPVVSPTPQATPSFTGNGILVTPEPQQVFTGTSPVPPLSPQATPSFAGGGITVLPEPQQVLTGTGPVPPLTTLPTPSFTGVGLPTIVVVPAPQNVITGFGPVPSTIIVTPQPVASPQAVPQPVPQQVPQATPVATPLLIPQLRGPAPQGPIPGNIGIATVFPEGTSPAPIDHAGVHQSTTLVVPRPKPRPAGARPIPSRSPDITHRPDPVATAVGQSQITPQAGRQDRLNPPQFAASDGGENWRCVASGHGQRQTQEGQRVAQSGALRHVGAIDVMGRDLPALHPRHSDCLVTVRRRND